jgi:hypothetical protein
MARTHWETDERMPPVGGMDIGSADADDGGAHEHLAGRWSRALDPFDDYVIHGTDDDTAVNAHRLVAFSSDIAAVAFVLDQCSLKTEGSESALRSHSDPFG